MWLRLEAAQFSSRFGSVDVLFLVFLVGARLASPSSSKVSPTSVPINSCPRTVLRAFENRIAQKHLVVACRECWEFPRSREISSINVIVEVPEKLVESVRIALCVAAGIRRVSARRRTHQPRIFDQLFIPLVASSKPKLVWLLGIP